MKKAVKETFSGKTRIFIVEDHPLFREGIAQLINTEDDLEVCGGAAGAPDALEQIAVLKPDLVIVDITLKNSSGIDLTRELHKKYESLPILVLSMHDEPIFADRVLKAGASGYITKEESTDSVIRAIRRVLSGKMYISDDIMDHFLNRFKSGGKNIDASPVESLSEREFEVFNLIGQGHTNRQIGDMLCVSSRTISTYRERIKEKLNIESNAELNRYILRWMQAREQS
ncbi:MAG TPA: response regulator transcription factor [Spirochaetota bacterium]|nr:response regulator transcription factor [Spirochaetota bacterium]